MEEIRTYPILSVSRRTDIPAFFAKPFVEALKAGRWGKPHIIFFWSKNFQPLLEYLPEIHNMGIKAVFQFTVNNYPDRIEPAVPNIHQRIETFHALKEFGSVIWRYDPIAYETKSGSKANREWHIATMKALAEELQPSKLVFSFVDAYGKIKENMAKAGIRPLTGAEERDIAKDIAKLAQDGGFTAATCAESGDFPGISHSSCIDSELIAQLCPELGHIAKDPKQRKACGCAQSYDIGRYHTCKHGCIYCYAQ